MRRDQLEEAMEIIRALWTGETVSHHGTHYQVSWPRSCRRRRTSNRHRHWSTSTWWRRRFRAPDIDLHLAAIREYEKAGFDELYIQQIGADQDEFLAAYREHILPHFESAVLG